MKIYFDELKSMPKLYISKKRELKIYLAIPFIIFSAVYLACAIADPKGVLQLQGTLTLIEGVLLPILSISLFPYFLTKYIMKSCSRYITDEHIFCAPVKDVKKILVVRYDVFPKSYGYMIWVIYKKKVRNKEKYDAKAEPLFDKYDGKKGYHDFLRAIENLEKDLGIKIPIEFFHVTSINSQEFPGVRHYLREDF